MQNKQSTKYRVISVSLILLLLLPVLLTVTVGVAEASGSLFGDQTSLLRSLIMIAMAFLLDSFVGDQKVDTDSGDPPVTEIPGSDSSYPPVSTIGPGEKEVLGFYVNWNSDTESYPALKKQSSNIDMVAPFWYTITSTGALENKYGGKQRHVDNFTRQQGQLILPLINNDKTNSAMLTNANIRRKAINNIVKLVERNNYDGVNIDFEFIPHYTKDDFTTFMRELSQKLRSRGKMVTVSVFPKVKIPTDIMGAYDYQALAKYIDRMLIMTYDHHWSTGPAGPIAPLDWVEQNIQYAIRYVPSDKILLGIANYGRNWPNHGGKAQELSSKNAIQLAKNTGSTIRWDSNSKTPYFSYTDNRGTGRTVWYENSYSLDFKLRLVHKYNLKGIGIWRLGNSNQRFWDIIRKRLNK
mgnify:FL=1